MKPKLNKNLSLPWTPHGDKASGTISSHEKNYELIFTISLSDLPSRVSCINSLTSPTVLLDWN